VGKIVWTEKASVHLRAIHDYIAEDSSVYATRFIKSLVQATAKLEVFPMAGRSVPEFEGTSIDLREVIYQGYRIIYRLTPDQDVEIVTVAHGREDLFNNLYKDWIL
jgi:plasmid stabilization system protein ParE